MDSLVFHLDADKANVNLLESIKAYFGTQKIEILVRPEKKPAAVIDNEEEENTIDKKTVFLNELDEAVDYVNNYKKGKTPTTSFKQMLDAL
jgi:hypothetical protein